MIGQYRPGNSVLHRLPATAKLLVTLGWIAGLAFFPRALPVAISLVIVAGLFWVGRLRWRDGWDALRPLLYLAVPLAVFQVWRNGSERAFITVGQLVVAVLVSAVLLRTTRVEDLVALVGRIFGERAALLIAITIRTIPRVAAMVDGARDACAARGIRPGPVRVLPMVVIRLVKDADRLGEAITARNL